jgi:hypothetical protein
MQRFQGLIGIALILSLAIAFSNNRRRINIRLVLSGITLQLLIGIMVLKVEPVIYFFKLLRRVMGNWNSLHFRERLLFMVVLPYRQKEEESWIMRWVDLFSLSM